MRQKILYVEKEMKAVSTDEVLLDKDTPYPVDIDGRIEMNGGLKCPLDYLWVDFRVVHLPIK
jgi:hypothetical protein